MNGYLRGHAVTWDDLAAAWRWQDTGELVSSDPDRPCPQCQQSPTMLGHDACLGEISGASGACCGHGRHLGYVNWTHVAVGPEWQRGAYITDETE